LRADEVCHYIESEEVGWEVERKEVVRKKIYWVVVVRDEGVWGPDAVLSGQMLAGEVGGAKEVEEVEVDVILENLKSKSRSAHISRF